MRNERESGGLWKAFAATRRPLARVVRLVGSNVICVLFSSVSRVLSPDSTRRRTGVNVLDERSEMGELLRASVPLACNGIGRHACVRRRVRGRRKRRARTGYGLVGHLANSGWGKVDVLRGGTQRGSRRGGSKRDRGRRRIVLTRHYPVYSFVWSV
jgi:hypothetical protein